MASKSRACGTDISVAPATIHSSCSTNSGIWNGARSGPATCIVPMRGKRFSNRSSHATKERRKVSPFKATPPSLSRTYTNSWKPRASISRSAFRQIGFSGRESVICASGRLGDRRIMSSGSTRAFTTRQGGELVSSASSRRQSGMASRRAVPPRRIHRHELALRVKECRRVLQQARDVRAMDQRGQRGHQRFACSFMRSPTISGLSCVRSRCQKQLKCGHSRVYGCSLR